MTIKVNVMLLSLLPLKIYDNGGKTLDRYTIVPMCRKYFKPRKVGGVNLYNAIASSDNGLGVFMWVECSLGRHLGKKVEFSSLSIELQKRVINALIDWS